MAENKLMTKRRNAALDVLRCLLMFGVILTHVCAFCQYGARVPYEEYAFWERLAGPAVDGFAVLSGWFGVRCSLRKLWKLACLIFFCGTLVWLVHALGEVFLGEVYRAKFGFEIPHWPWCYERYRFWYLGAYVKLLVLSIVLNPVLSRIARLKRYWIALIAILFVVVSYVSTLWVHWERHSPRTIIFIYILVRFVMMFDFAERLRENQWLHRVVGVLLLACLLMIAFDSYWRAGLRTGHYGNPFMVMAGFLAVAWCSALKTRQDAIGIQFFSKAAPSVVAIYMLHVGFTHGIFVPIPQFLMQWVSPASAFLLCALALFAVCLGIDLVRRNLLSLIREHAPKNGVLGWCLA